MSTLLSLLGGLWANVGPGLLLALTLPLFLLAFGAIVAVAVRRRSAKPATTG